MAQQTVWLECEAEVNDEGDICGYEGEVTAEVYDNDTLCYDCPKCGAEITESYDSRFDVDEDVWRDR